MTKEKFEKMERGCVIQHVRSGSSFVIEQCVSPKQDKFIGVRTIVITNPDEWIIVKE